MALSLEIDFRARKTVSIDNATFTDLLTIFIWSCLEDRRTILPIFGEKWHKLLYQTREALAGKYPFISEMIGEFDWDGRYPTSRKLNKNIPALLYLLSHRHDFRMLVIDGRIVRSYFFSRSLAHLFLQLRGVISEMNNLAIQLKFFEED